MKRTLRRSALGLAIALGLASTSASSQQSAAPVLSPEVARQYVQPHERIDIGGGRRLNLFCMGSGKQTVLFDSGGSDWSVIWALVQPALAADARVCTYDRAGLGYSDPAPGARSPMAIADDMHALVKAASLKTPLVLVGHSLGGFNVKLYTALYPEDVAGLVLVDPSEERSDQRSARLVAKRLGEPGAARKEVTDLMWLGRLLDRYRTCQDLARSGNLDPATIEYRRCSDPVRAPLGPEIAAERQKIQVTAAYQQAQASEILNSVYGDTRPDSAYARLFRPGLFGDRPTIVLTHGLYDPSDPIDAADYEATLALHQESAALSRRGRHRVIPDTSHNIEIDKPQAIVDAVREVLRNIK
ncbi:MAG TPA: alpha/beta hydrolase [Allosphingosinicella sp.]|jgi:pimeloyl-ACP methyl ester carboxylesterase